MVERSHLSFNKSRSQNLYQKLFWLLTKTWICDLDIMSKLGFLGNSFCFPDNRLKYILLWNTLPENICFLLSWLRQKEGLSAMIYSLAAGKAIKNSFYVQCCRIVRWRFYQSNHTFVPKLYSVSHQMQRRFVWNPSLIPGDGGEITLY